MKRYIFGTLIPILFGTCLGLCGSVLLSGCDDGPAMTGGYDGGTGPIFIPRAYTCTVSGTATATTTSGSTTSPVTNALAVFDGATNVLAIGSGPTRYYDLVLLDDTLGTREWAIDASDPAQSTVSGGLFRFQYRTQPVPVSIQYRETFPDGAALDVRLTGSCTEAGI